jgi:hypothetical protein
VTRRDDGSLGARPAQTEKRLSGGARSGGGLGSTCQHLAARAKRKAEQRRLVSLWSGRGTETGMALWSKGKRGRLAP